MFFFQMCIISKTTFFVVSVDFESCSTGGGFQTFGDTNEVAMAYHHFDLGMMRITEVLHKSVCLTFFVTRVR